MTQLARHKTSVVFALCTGVTIASILLLFLLGRWALILLVLSVGFNIWSLLVSERRGFVRSNQIRRAHEPQRHFNAAQVLAVLAYIMIQIGAGTYFLLMS